MGMPAEKMNPSQGPGPVVRKLQKGELLFSEGENSRAMYVIKSGMIRIYKKKGDSLIEIDTVRAGQILGELAFLDGNPRSASGEALTECTLVEISGATFQNVLTNMPEWLKMLLKTVVGRLRTASTRIRQLEAASTAYDYSDKDGKRSSHYVYLSQIDVLKITSALLLCGLKAKGNSDAKQVPIKTLTMNKYANTIMGIPVAKITTMLDTLSQVGIVAMENDTDPGSFILKDSVFLDQLINYLNEEYLLEPSKRHELSLKGFLIMSLIAKHLSKYNKDPESGIARVDVGNIRNVEMQESGREPFRIEELGELVKLGYAGNIDMKSSDEVYTEIKVDAFIKAFRMQKVAVAINVVNEQKRKGATVVR